MSPVSNDSDIFSNSRVKYISDGGHDPARFVFAGALVMLFAALLGCGLALLTFMGLNFIVIMPTIAGFACGAVAAYALKFSHCRNKIFAAMFGAMVGLTAYIGCYHACFTWEVGIANAHRIDALPFYIHARWQTDTVGDAKDQIRKRRDEEAAEPVAAEFEPNAAQFWMNVGLFSLEAILAMGAAGSLTLAQVKKPYCSRHRRWLSEATGLPQPSSNSFEQGRTIQDWLVHKDASEFVVHYCEDPQAVTDPCEFYLSAYKADAAQKHRRSESLLDTIALRSSEIAEFAALLPADRLKSIAQSENAQWREVADGIQQLSRETVETVGYDSLATVQKVEPEHYGQFNSTVYLQLRNSMALFPIVFLLLGFALLFCPLMFPIQNAMITLSFPLCGLAALALGGTACKLISTMPYNWMRRQAESEFAARSKSLVDFKQDSRFALVMPRNEIQSNFFRKWDFGLLQADLSRKELRFEGDMERYRIPLASIVEFAIDRELFCSDPKSPSHEYLVRIRFQTAEGPVERLFAQRHLWRAGSSDEARLTPAKELADYLTFTNSESLDQQYGAHSLPEPVMQ